LFFLYKYSYFYIISIKSIRESGLYNNWIQLFLKLLGNTQFIQQEVNHNIVKFEEMSFNQTLDVIYFYICAIIISIFTLFIEYIIFKLNLYFINKFIHKFYNNLMFNKLDINLFKS